MRAARPPPEEEVGVVVGRLDLGESDRVLRVLTPDRGRTSLVARGARSTNSRFAAADLGARVRFAAREGRAGLQPVVSLTVEDGRPRLRNAWGRILLATYACEVAGALAREHHAEPRLYGLLETALLVLDACDVDPESGFRAGFEAKALTFAGIGPALDRCAACDGALDEPLGFGAGGVRHRRCEAPEERGVAVSVPFVAALEHARRSPLASLLGAALPPGPGDALAGCIEAWLGRPLASRALLEG